MSLEHKPDGRWFLDIEPSKGKRYRRHFKTKAEALRFDALARQKHTQHQEWNPKPKDRRRLLEVVDRWYALHGHTLSDGKRRHAILSTLAHDLGNPIAYQLTGNHFVECRKRQLDAGTHGKTLNNRLGYLKSVFNVMHELGEIDYENPLIRVRPLKLQERQLSYLTQTQIDELLGALERHSRLPHVRLIARICLETGARWGEAESLKPSQVHNRSVTFVNTKSKRVRTIPIRTALEKEILDHFRLYGPFNKCLVTFDRALKASGIELPKGQSSHVLRHTFASHFMMNGGNILTLQKILGHSSLNMTMRYAHLSPDHLQDAVKLGPLVKL